MMDDNGSYIFYADESGDHSLTSIDQTYPVFALSLCAFRKDHYCEAVIPDFQKLKFKYFGHDIVILHEHDIRKQHGYFRILTDGAIRARFLEDLSDCIVKSEFDIFSTVILKPELKTDFFPENPYVIALRICLQNAWLFLKMRGEHLRKVHFVFEKRGAKEDIDLELEFRRIAAGDNDLHERFSSFEIHFSDKRTNSIGMQIADLTARPIGLSILRPMQPNRAFDLISPKLYRSRRFSRIERGIFTP